MRKPKVGDKVITKGYCDTWDGKVITINRVVTVEYKNLGIKTFCYFDEDSRGYCNFEEIDIHEYLDQIEPKMKINGFSFVN